MRVLQYFLLPSLAFLMVFQPYPTVAQNDDLVEQTRDVGSFNAISVESGINVFVEQRTDQKVVVKARERAINNIRTEIKGNSLIISREKKSLGLNEDVTVYLTVSELNAVDASGGSDVSSSGPLKSDRFALNASGGSDVTLEIESNTVQVNISGGSDVILSGDTDRLEFVASGGSDLRAENLIVKKCMATVSGASDANLHVTDELQVVASGSSDIVYSGNAKIINQQTSGSSDIRKQ